MSDTLKFPGTSKQKESKEKAKAILSNLVDRLSNLGHGEINIRLVARDGVLTNLEETTTDKTKLI